MSIALNSEETSNNPLNTSTSKMLYSFPRGKRFKKQSALDVPFYSLPNLNTKRTTSMGFGNKTSFQDPRNMPPPDKYIIPSEFNSKQKLGPSFGIGREDSKASSVSMFKFDNVPGPGSYNLPNRGKNRSASIRSRGKDHSLDQIIKIPGPGSYNVNFSTVSGKMLNSRYQSIKSPRMNKIEAKVSEEQRNFTPSPCQYTPMLITSKGDKFMRNGKAYKFSLTHRRGLAIQNKTPGPGQYNSFSEFSS